MFSQSVELFPRNLIAIQGPGAPAPSGVFVELELHRSSVGSVSLLRGQNGPVVRAEFYRAADPGALPRNIRYFDLGFLQRQFAPLVLETTTPVEPARISAFVLVFDGHYTRARPAEPCGSRLVFKSFPRHGPATPLPQNGDGNDPLLITPEDYVRLMSRRLTADWKHPLAKARQFFFLLDYETHPFLRPIHCPKPISDRLVSNLADRLEYRARRLHEGRPGSRALTETTANAVRGVMAVMSRLVKRCFATIDECKRAFAAFASGETRFQVVKHSDGTEEGMWTTQPSSGYFFLFGELALVAATLARHDADPDATHLWSHLAEAAIRAQPVFVAAYARRLQKGEKRWFDGFDPCKVLSQCPEEIDRLVGRLTPASSLPDLNDLRLLAAEHARQFLPRLIDNPLPPRAPI